MGLVVLNDTNDSDRFPLLDPEDVETLRLAATDQDFLIRETAARFMASAARESQVALLELLITDRYPQVQEPARAALSGLAPATAPDLR